MKPLNKQPKIEARELRDGSGWYALVTWGDRPSEQVGGFSTEAEARHWIAHGAAAWVKEHIVEENAPGYDRG
jgi:hypothetical protein